MSDNTTAVRRETAAPARTSGWIDAIGFVLSVGLLTLIYGVGHALGANPIAFVLYATLFAGGSALWVSKGAVELKAVLAHPNSWLIGIASIGVEILYYLMLTYAYPAHGNVVLRMSVPLALLAGWCIFNRVPRLMTIFGAIGVFIAAMLAVGALPPQVKWPVTLATSGGACFIVFRSIIMELHPKNRAANSIRARLSITGSILFATSTIGIALCGIASLAVQLGIVPPLSVVPTSAQLLNIRTIAIAGTIGGGTLTLMTYLNLSAVSKLGTERVIAMMAFTPISAYMFQAVGALLLLVPQPNVNRELAPALLVLAVSVGIVLASSRGHGSVSKALNRRADKRPQ